MRVGIAGYGNLGRSLEGLLLDAKEAELVGIFTRRGCEDVHSAGTAVYHVSELEVRDDIDVLFLCYGSSSDLPVIGPRYAERFNTVDTFDNHKRIESYKDSMDEAAKRGGNVSVVSLGWDPGFLSLIRLYSCSFLPHASVNTFWGRGVSQGHSEALRRIDGVKRAIQYTVPREDALTLAGLVSHPFLDTERHRRVCYIVAEKGNEDSIADEILSMENYFLGYETEIHFISEDELERYHTSLSHRGRIIALGSSGRYRETKHALHVDLDIGSNPDFTASIMLAGARAAYRIKKGGGIGAYSPFDIPPSHFLRFDCKNANKYL